MGPIIGRVLIVAGTAAVGALALRHMLDESEKATLSDEQEHCLKLMEQSLREQEMDDATIASAIANARRKIVSEEFGSDKKHGSSSLDEFLDAMSSEIENGLDKLTKHVDSFLDQPTKR